MKKLNILLIVVSLLVGVFIGHNVPKTNNDIQNIKTMDTTEKMQEYNSQVEFYDNIIKDIDTVKIYNTNELTTEILTNRNGKIIIEKVIGKVENDNLDGKIINCIDEQHDYITYKRVDGVKKNDIVLTYFIYNPLTNVKDDILTRIDYIIDYNSI